MPSSTTSYLGGLPRFAAEPMVRAMQDAPVKPKAPTNQEVTEFAKWP